MYKFIFTKYSEKQFIKLDKNTQDRVKTKLKSLKEVDDINVYIKVLHDLHPATHRLRIWNYRLLLEIKNTNIIIYKIAHRRQVYK